MGNYKPNDSRRVTLNEADKKPGKLPAEGWHEKEQRAGEPVEPYEPEDSRNVTLNPDDQKRGQRAEAGWPETEQGGDAALRDRR